MNDRQKEISNFCCDFRVMWQKHPDVSFGEFIACFLSKHPDARWRKDVQCIDMIRDIFENMEGEHKYESSIV